MSYHVVTPETPGKTGRSGGDSCAGVRHPDPLIAVILGQWLTDPPSSFGVTTFVLTVSSVRRQVAR